MIAFVSGTLVEKSSEEAVVEAGGLGYRLLIPLSTYQKLPDTGEDVVLRAHESVNTRDGTRRLFGFATVGERDVFETITAVSRVGPKLALAVLSGLSPGQLRAAVMDEQTGRLTEISGVGKKTAQRMIVELKDKLDDVETADDAAPLSGGDDAARRAARADALSALQSMGMSKADAERALRKALRADAGTRDAGELVRRALNEQE